MQRIILALIALLTVTIGYANLSLATAGGMLEEGDAKAASGDIRGALAIYESLASNQPDSHELQAKVGGMLLLDQRYADAVERFQLAISLGDTGTRSFLGMGMAYLHMGQLGPARAAFVEAKSRGAENPANIDDIIHWIDTRQPASRSPHR